MFDYSGKLCKFFECILQKNFSLERKQVLCIYEKDLFRLASNEHFWLYFAGKWLLCGKHESYFLHSMQKHGKLDMVGVIITVKSEIVPYRNISFEKKQEYVQKRERFK